MRNLLCAVSFKAPASILAAVLIGVVATSTACSGASGAAASCPAKACQNVAGHNADGSCQYVALANGLTCNDGNPCTAFETCQNGNCTDGAVVADGTICDDGNACTSGDSCQSGACTGGAAVVCGAPETCEAAYVCDPNVGCLAGTAGPCVSELAPVTLTGCTFYGYTAPVVVGGQAMSLLVDTGSTTTAVASATCANCNGLSPLYSNDGEATGNSASVSYNDGSSWTATIYTDTVQPQLTNARGQAPQLKPRFASLQQQTSFFPGSGCTGTLQPNAYQGIWGLGPQAGASSGTDAYLDLLAASGATLFDAFAVQLCDSGGHLWLGGYNPSAGGNGPLLQTPLQTSANGDGSHYAISLVDILVGSQSLGLTSFAYGSVLVDTATSGLMLPQAAFDALQQMLTQDANVIAALDLRTLQGSDANTRLGYPGLHAETPDELDAKLPWLTLQLPQGGATTDFTLALRPTKSYLSANLLSSNSTTQYVYTFTAFASASTIFGAAMLKEHIVVFDRGNGLVGFLPQASGCTIAVPYTL